MPFIWSDETFFERVRKQNKYDKLYFFPVLMISFVFFSFFLYEKLGLVKILFMSLILASVFSSFMSLILQLPNFKIPEDYHPYAKTAIRMVQFIVNLIIAYYVWYKIIQPSLQ